MEGLKWDIAPHCWAKTGNWAKCCDAAPFPMCKFVTICRDSKYSCPAEKKGALQVYPMYAHCLGNYHEKIYSDKLANVQLRLTMSSESKTFLYFFYVTL